MLPPSRVGELVDLTHSLSMIALGRLIEVTAEPFPLSIGTQSLRRKARRWSFASVKRVAEMGVGFAMLRVSSASPGNPGDSPYVHKAS
jgi:hypothetical protein